MHREGKVNAGARGEEICQPLCGERTLDCGSACVLPRLHRLARKREGGSNRSRRVNLHMAPLVLFSDDVDPPSPAHRPRARLGEHRGTKEASLVRFRLTTDHEPTLFRISVSHQLRPAAAQRRSR